MAKAQSEMRVEKVFKDSYGDDLHVSSNRHSLTEGRCYFRTNDGDTVSLNPAQVKQLYKQLKRFLVATGELEEK